MLLPVRIEAFGQPLQAARELGVPGHANASDRRCIVTPEHRQLPDQCTQGAAHAEIGFALGVDRTDQQPLTLDPHL